MFHFAPSKGHTIHYLSPTLRLWDLDAGEVMKELMDLWYPLVSSHPDPPKIFQNHKLCEVDSSIVCESWGWRISGPEYFEILFDPVTTRKTYGCLGNPAGNAFRALKVYHQDESVPSFLN